MVVDIIYVILLDKLIRGGRSNPSRQITSGRGNTSRQITSGGGNPSRQNY